MGAVKRAQRLRATIRNVVGEISHARRLSGDASSWLRWSADIIVIRLMRVVRWPGRDLRRTITLTGGERLTYRLNRGDLLTLREVWIDEVYRVPGGATAVPRTLVDLGANIGLTSVWFARVYGCDEIVAVEPLPENAELLRHNLAQNGISATVLDGAVDPAGGTGFFARANEPNSGRLGRDGLQVDLFSMDTVLNVLDPGPRAIVVKLDIEGAEQALFAGELDWLASVQIILAELHPALVDAPRIIEAIETAGFEQMQPSSDLEGAVTCFRRHSKRGDDEC